MKDQDGRREQYPSLLITPAQRKAFFDERNRRMQERGVKPADGVTFGKGKRDAVSKRGSA